MTLQIGIALEMASDSDAEELSRETVLVRRRLLELDIDSIDFVRDREAPIGAKAGDASSLGELVVLAPAASLTLRAIVSLIRDHIRVGATRTARLQIDGDTLTLSGVSPELQDKIADAWIERHSASSHE